MAFKKATRSQSYLRMALIGPSGSGKTYSALALAKYLGPRVALIDTERGSASKYAPGGASGFGFDFDALELDTFHPQAYIDAIEEAAKARYEVLIVDSLSHAWTGPGGALELVDEAARKSRTGNTFGAWREVTPIHNRLVDALVRFPGHLLVTLRSKVAYVQESIEQPNGRTRTEIRKVGLQPVQRDGLEYEFDLVGELDSEHYLKIDKSRCPELTGQVVQRPGKALAEQIATWLSDGAPRQEQPQLQTQAPAPGSTGPDRDLILARIFRAAGDAPAYFAAKRGADLDTMPIHQLAAAAEYLESEAGAAAIAKWRASARTPAPAPVEIPKAGPRADDLPSAPPGSPRAKRGEYHGLASGVPKEELDAIWTAAAAAEGVQVNLALPFAAGEAVLDRVLAALRPAKEGAA